MGPELEKRIARVAGDRESGASEILADAVAILREALQGGGDVEEVADALCRAQPAMAPMWNAARAARVAQGQPERFFRFAERVRRAPAAIARFAVECFRPEGASPVPVRIVTMSYSATVVHAIQAIARERSVQVACSEGRPGLEGRKLAQRLAALGVPVTFFTDAAVGHGLEESDAVLVGADAVAPTFFINKSGTGMLAAAAELRGLPVYVVASQDKFLDAAAAMRLELRDGAPAEVWSEAVGGVRVRNPYFERIPVDRITTAITDLGLVGAGAIPDVCGRVPFS